MIKKLRGSLRRLVPTLAPFKVSARGAVTVNDSYFIQRFCLENLVLFEQEEGWFFVYRDDNGAWVRVVPEVIKEMMRSDWEHLCNTSNWQFLLIKGDNALLNSLVNGIKSHSGRTKVFKPLETIIHCANGMLHLLDDGQRTAELRHFSPDYYSRNPIPIDWNDEAPAPMLDAILAPMPKYDSSLFLRYAGNILLMGNVAQSMLIITGEGGTSKSTLCELIELVMGRTNVIELRTQFLHERFEIGRYIGKTLLTGKDVPGEFLNTPGAQALKKLTGHDYQTGEIKNQMATPEIRGDFAVLITCNERLLVKLEGASDVSAWKRRLLIITLSAASKHREVIGEYAKKMFASEAEGVLYRMVQGAFDHLEELKVRAEFGLHPAQVARVDALLAESQSIEMFLKAKVVKRAGEQLTSEQLAKGYADYCEEQGWEALELKKVQRELPNKMFGLFGTHLVNGVEDPNTGKRVRGYRNVAFAGEEPEDDGRQYADVPPECAEDMFK